MTNEARLAKLKSQKKSYRTKLTRFSHFLDVERNQHDITQITARLENIKDLLKLFENADNEINELTEQETDELEEFENTYYQEITRARNFIKAATESNPPQGTSRSSNSSNETMSRNIRLPKIQLSTFDGSFNHWLDFHDSFKNIIDSDKSLANVEKLHYLRSCLKGEAASVIKSLESTEENYTVAWNLLIERFDNRRAIVQGHVRALMKLPILSKESPADLQKLLDETNIHMRALKSLQEKVEHWDTLLIYIITSKLDRNTHREWEKTLTDSSMPTITQFLEFLVQRCKILQATALNVTTINNTKQHNTQMKRQAFTSTSKSISCYLCKEAHQIYACDKFRSMTIAEKYDAVRSNNACLNCLKIGHRSADCKSQGCKKCSKKHNSLLHYDKQKDNVESNKNDNINDSTVKVLNAMVATQVLLSTALVEVKSANGKRIQARVLLDSGSQSNFMTEKFAESLGLSHESVNLPVEGLNQMETKIKKAVNTTIYSKQTNFQANLRFLILPRVCDYLPNQFINKNQLNIPHNIKLADPEFYKPGKIDALLGAELFYDLMCIGQIQLAGHSAKITKTKLGWVISGRIGYETKKLKSNNCLLSLDSLHKDIAKFWELEELIEQKFLSEEEFSVEKHYIENTIQDTKTGRYIVRLPFNEKIKNLGNSYQSAQRRFLSLERKLSRDPELKRQYNQFMRDYVELGHMKEVTADAKNIGYFMPHHAVIKESSQTTKLRVVFDASAKTDTGLSLNNCLKNGPTIQQDIFSIIVRFRTHQYVLTADVEKMYRQILVDDRDAQYQQLLHREHENDPLKIFRAITVTYGTTSAPFLAIRTLFKLADDMKTEFPNTSKIIKRDFYVDDILTGADTITDTIKLRDELIKVTERGCFPLRKWQSNCQKVIESLSSGVTNVDLLAKTDIQKTLGVQWDSINDLITYQVKPWDDLKVTKRKILSNIAQLYDPVGLLGPVIVNSKLLMQKLWQCNVTWDESVPLNIFTTWNNIRDQLHLLQNIKFNRKVIVQNSQKVELHGFADASEKAYGACIYIRSINNDNKITTELLCSKNRVAPLKSISLPKLELCAALLLSKLVKSTSDALDRKIDDMFLWSDSTITLQWIQTQPHLLKTFVANRVSEIRTTTNINCWRHVPTKENPADCLSRGQLPSEFIKNELWKFGPHWLRKDSHNWPSRVIEKVPLSEMKTVVALKVTTDHTSLASLLNKYSSFSKLQRVFAYCLRFINNSLNTDSKHAGPLHVTELNQALKKIIKIVQSESFENELKSLSKSQSVPNISHLKSLNPFLDNEGIIRVGGRLKNSVLSYSEQHPLVLPKNHHVTNLIIKHTHIKHLHSGVQATLYAIRKTFWPISGKSAVRKIVKKCIKCFRAKPDEHSYIMGDLPHTRVTQTRPFLNTGIDYCGPFFLKEKKFRNRNKIKVYAAIFICFATKACHIELVTDLTTEAFLASLRRFFARRGKSLNIYSDNATNFVGANRELKSLYDFTRSQSHNQKLSETLSQNNITWHFSPPRSPHFGGLWEAAVKSFKYHFQRTIGQTLFTYEELYTYATEIEAILNSRPITPISSDPNDLNALCPSHFLIGDSLMSLPHQDLTNIKINQLSAWQHIQFVKQHFWKRWSKEYLHNLNVRTKWQQQRADNIKIGTMVILKEENTPPLHWPLGRIVNVHPGADGIVRAVTVKTVAGTYSRSAKSVSPLPIDEKIEDIKN